MRYISLDNDAWTCRWNSKQNAIRDECFADDDAADGFPAETGEVLSGILILGADERDHAVELMSRHPGVRVGYSSSARRNVKIMGQAPA